MVLDMSSILFGLALISATLQTTLAMFAEGQFNVMPVVIIMLYIGWRSLKSGAVSMRHGSISGVRVTADTRATG